MQKSLELVGNLLRLSSWTGRRTLIAGLLLAVFAATPAWADSDAAGGKRLAIGVEAGYYANGISLKYDLTRSHALQFGADFWRHDGAFIHGEYIVSVANLAHNTVFMLPIYVGLGAALAPWEHTNFAIQGHLGLDFQFSKIPLDFFAEWSPTFFFGQFSADYDNRNLGGCTLGIRFHL